MTSPGVQRSASARSTATFPPATPCFEAVYVDEFEAMAGSAARLDELDPWDALATWLRQFVRDAATRRALAEELLADIEADADVFTQSRAAINGAGEPLLARAQMAGVVRSDTDFNDIGRLVCGIAAIRGADPEQIERLLALALDGLRYRPQEPGATELPRISASSAREATPS